MIFSSESEHKNMNIRNPAPSIVQSFKICGHSTNHQRPQSLADKIKLPSSIYSASGKKPNILKKKN